MICPVCAGTLPSRASQCPACGADLTEYLTAKYQPDLLFNEALDCLKQQNYADACDLLCLAHTMRPDDAGILALRVRAEYLSGDKKRAIELLTDLMELDDSPALAEQLNQIIREYDAEQMSAETAIKAQNARLAGLLDRMERCLDAHDAGTTEPPPAPSLDFSLMMDTM